MKLEVKLPQFPVAICSYGLNPDPACVRWELGQPNPVKSS